LSDIDATTLLPADESDHGFDNIVAVLSISPALLERYLSAARKISRLAVGDPSAKPGWCAGSILPKKTWWADRRIAGRLSPEIFLAIRSVEV
jgi:hypothetical protein